MSEPTTAEEWHTAVDAANAMLAMRRALDYGLITYESMDVNIPRCEDILRRGAALGYLPNDAAIPTLVRGFVERDGGDPDGDVADQLAYVVLAVAHEAIV